MNHSFSFLRLYSFIYAEVIASDELNNLVCFLDSLPLCLFALLSFCPFNSVSFTFTFHMSPSVFPHPCCVIGLMASVSHLSPRRVHVVCCVTLL